MQSIRFKALPWAMVALSLLLVAGPARSQDTAAAGTSAAARPEPPSLLQFIHADFCVAIVIHPSRIMNSPVMKQIPLEMLSGMAGPAAADPGKPGSTGSSVEMRKWLPKIRRVTALFAPATGDKVPVEAAGIVQFAQAADVDEFIATAVKGNKGAKPTEVQGIKSWVDAKDGIILCPAGGRIVVFGKEPTLKKMLAVNSGERPLVTQLGRTRLDHDIIVEIHADPIFAAVAKTTGKSPADMVKEAKGMEQFAVLATETKSVSLVIDLTGDTLARLAITAASEDSANKMLGLLSLGQMMGQGMYDSNKKEVAKNIPPGAPPESVKTVTDLVDDLVKGIKVLKEGNSAVISVAMPKNLEQLPQAIMNISKSAGPAFGPPSGPSVPLAPGLAPDSGPPPGPAAPGRTVDTSPKKTE
jgi:hypothetical protein